MPETISQRLLYKKAGTFILIPYVNGVPTKANQYIEPGIIDTIQRNGSETTKDIPDGNSTDPAFTLSNSRRLHSRSGNNRKERKFTFSNILARKGMYSQGDLREGTSGRTGSNASSF
jgi:hypothetical protein